MKRTAHDNRNGSDNHIIPGLDRRHSCQTIPGLARSESIPALVRRLCCQRIPALARQQAILACAFLAVFLAVFSTPQPAAAETATTPQHPRVIWLQDPAHQATIVWVTEERGENHKVYFDTEPRDAEPDAYRHEATATRHIEELEDNVWFHHAVLEDLHPSTRYHFTVETDGERSEERYFETAPADDRPVDLLYGGDSRSDPENRREMNRRIRELFDQNDKLIGMVHGGDYVEAAVIWSQLAQWLDDWELTTGDDGEVIPIIPARGNHELSPNQLNDKPDNYNGLFGMPGGPDNDYWTTEIGSRIAIVTLDTNGTLGGDQRDWLKSELQRLTDERTWIVPSYHRPAYPAVKRAGAARQHWVPLFEEYNVDLVLESDGHVLKRTVPIRDGEKAEDGIVYIGEGGLGVKQRTARDRWYLESPGMATSSHHVQLLSFGPDELTYRAVGMDGATLDSRTFQARREADPTPLAIDSARVASPTRLEVDFTKGLDADSIDASDFETTPELEVREAVRHEDYDDHVILQTAELEPGTEYTLRVTGVADLLGRTPDDPLVTSVLREESAPAGDASDSTDTSNPPDDADDAEVAEPSGDSPEPSGAASSDSGCSTTGGGPLPLGVVGLLVVIGLARRFTGATPSPA